MCHVLDEMTVELTVEYLAKSIFRKNVFFLFLMCSEYRMCSEGYSTALLFSMCRNKAQAEAADITKRAL